MSTARSTRRSVLWFVVGVVAFLSLAYLVWFALLNLGSEEGDVPSASSMRFPEGATVVSTEKECGSGGCWSTFTVRPAAGTSAAALETYLATTFDGRVPGSFADPTTIGFMTVDEGDELVVTASYWATYEGGS
jgi:hypothetical protein